MTPTPLSRREAQVCGLVAEAHPTKDVAVQLGISPRTVERHRDHIMHKLKIHSVVELTHWALARGLARNLFLFVALCLLLSPSEAFPDLGPKDVRGTAGNSLVGGRAVAAAPPQPKAEQQLRPTDPDAEMRAAIEARRAHPVTNEFRVPPVVKFHRKEKSK